MKSCDLPPHIKGIQLRSNVNTVKFLKTETPKIIGVLTCILKIKEFLFLKEGTDRMANSEDPDQTAPQEQSDLGLHCLFKPSCPITYILRYTSAR